LTQLTIILAHVFSSDAGKVTWVPALRHN